MTVSMMSVDDEQYVKNGFGNFQRFMTFLKLLQSGKHQYSITAGSGMAAVRALVIAAGTHYATQH